MCNNAMTYNRPETIYNKEAKRLFQIGMKTLSKVSIHYKNRLNKIVHRYLQDRYVSNKVVESPFTLLNNTKNA